ncbi:proteasome subunit alpha [Actinocatenispora thailandica]|uniref:Proteasome subunit alpha n=1 Tax=Actinocatenispora thailandica TaxID=227318 RepID=A0A7R7DPZ1_9ACTN|nr:proteasome subunit alpha [Actinocatenispora thailandica]BCJ35606.1 proteasome subunit alpha [Actinocatenispora thailandica]
MTMPFYASPEQLMRDKSEYARKGIARGRSVVVLTYADGVLFVAENVSTALHKVAEIYDRIGFAAVGRYNEFENLRKAGVRYADVQGYANNRTDVRGLGLANVYAQALGTLFTEQPKPFEVEVCVAEVGDSPQRDQLYRLTYDGSVGDEPGYVAMGGQADAISAVLRDRHRADMTLAAALHLAVDALSGTGADRRELTAAQLEVAVLDRRRSGRTFRRITGTALDELVAQGAAESTADEPPADEATGADEPADAGTPEAESAAGKGEEPSKGADDSTGDADDK